jgi:5-methylcytosine-specific restriction endonuclease McrA
MLKNFPEKIPDLVAAELIKEFHSRCGRCGQKLPLSVHEIIPRGAIGKKALERGNRIPLCAACHSWAHTVGTSCSIPVLMSYRSRHD